MKFTASGSAFDMGERFGELESLAVSEDARGEGLGTQHIQACQASTAVSYTHLDVYKRQTSGFAPAGLGVPRIPSCLLYTSRCV